jgi:hypothetical protein
MKTPGGVPGAENARSTEPIALWVSDDYALDSDDGIHFHTLQMI